MDFQTFVGMRRWYNSGWTFEQTVNKLNHAASSYEATIVLDSSNNKGWSLQLLAGLGIHAKTELAAGQKPDRLQEFINENNDYVFGHFGYNLKEATEAVSSAHADTDGFPVCAFFVPAIVVLADRDTVKIGYFTDEQLSDFLQRTDQTASSTSGGILSDFSARTSQTEYLSKVHSLLSHIHRGDIYEINFCMELFAAAQTLDAISTYEKLKALTLAPYGGMYKWNQSWLFCGSPELYLRKSGDTIISQPIKGTRKRGANENEDLALRTELHNDQKERSENIMIVDLVRNDLSKVARKGSVRVTDLFGITSFKTVHQMSSTVECKVDADLPFMKAIAATFPMGSMTGAPKISAMELAEKFEDQSRGIYSGSIGYIAPDGDFEFNVVIRSIMWNSATGHLSVKAGSAITANSIPEKEYEECLLKAEAMMNALKR